MYHLFSSFLLFINFSLYSFCLSTPKSNFSSVLNIKIPGFNESGFLSWEIHADKISNKEKNLISAVKPSIYTYQNQKIQLTANTSSGLFDLNVYFSIWTLSASLPQDSILLRREYFFPFSISSFDDVFIDHIFIFRAF